jgi:hypothetical protein
MTKLLLICDSIQKIFKYLLAAIAISKGIFRSFFLWSVGNTLNVDKEDKSIPHYISLVVRRRNHDPKKWGKPWGGQSYIFQVHTINN